MSQAATGLLSPPPDYLSITSYNLDDANIGVCTLLKKDGFFSLIETLPFLKVAMVSQKPIQEMKYWYDDQLPIIHPWIIE